MPETEWMGLAKCGFGMYESLCSSCSVNYDYRELAASCDCCSRSPGNRLIVGLETTCFA